MKRVIESEERVKSYKNEDGDPFGPERVWLKDEDFPNLAISRSSGDEVAHSEGVISKPEINEYNFGIFEFISSSGEYVSKLKNFI